MDVECDPAANSHGDQASERLRLLMAMRLRRDRDGPSACRKQAAAAGAARCAEAVPALCDLLETPARLVYGLPWERRAWSRARAAAARALGEIGDPDALPTLARALAEDPSRIVRMEAAAALRPFGELAGPHLKALLRTSTEWTRDGMLLLISLLGELGYRPAGPSLAHALLGYLPPPVSRPASVPSLGCVTLTLSALLICGAIGSALHSVDIVALIGMLGMVCVIGYVGVCVLVGVPMEMVRTSRERTLFARAAAMALASTQDKKSLPSLIAAGLAHGWSPITPACHEALKGLLPLIAAEDAGLLSPDMERHLLTVFDCGDPGLVLAAVRALEHIGTGQSAGPLRRLVNRRPVTHDSLAFVEIRQEGERVLPILEERLRMHQSSRTLLRPVEPGLRAEELLRAAAPPNVDPPDQLLRPPTIV